MSKSIWLQRGNAIERCDATTGHSVKAVAFCDSKDVAREIIAAINSREWMGDALRALEGYITKECRRADMSDGFANRLVATRRLLAELDKESR